MDPAANTPRQPLAEAAEGGLGVGALPLMRKTSDDARARPVVPLEVPSDAP